MGGKMAWIVAIGAAGFTLGAAEALAQNYPTKTVRIIVPFPPVGAADLLARTIGQKLGEVWGHQVIVDNRPGVGGNLGVEIAAKAPPDGYTAVMAPITTNAIGMSTYTKLGYNLERDLAPVALAGNIPHVKTGRIRALGVASSKRSPALPEVPAINESLKGFEADSWFGLMMPAGTPREIIMKMNTETMKILGTQEVKDRLLTQGGVAAGGTPEQLAERIRADIAKWGQVARTAGVKIE